MKFRVRKRNREPQVVMVSLIDVVLQLVIFLVLTSTFKIGEVSIDIALPAVESAAAAVEDGITVELDGSGRITVAGREMSRAALKDLFRMESQRENARSVVIRADSTASHGEVVALIDLARVHDLRRLSIAAVPRGRDSSN
jgi:biopolymer transport protein ExbD